MSDVGGVSSGQLKSFIERIETLEEEKAAIGEQIRDVFAEAKGTGFDVKIIRQILKIRKGNKSNNSHNSNCDHNLNQSKSANLKTFFGH